jgi:hypothetical protein
LTPSESFKISPRDWQEQSGAVAVMYRDFYITLAAAEAESPDFNLFSKGYRCESKQTLAQLTHDNFEILIFVRTRFPHENFPLQKRGWVFQERLSSPHFMYFNHKELKPWGQTTQM